MKRLVPAVAIGAVMLFVVACGSQVRETRTVEFEDVAVYDGLWTPLNEKMYCLYRASSLGDDASLFRDDSLFLAIRDEAEWQNLWRSVQENEQQDVGRECVAEGDEPRFDVDFGREMLIVLAEVQPSSGYLVDVDSMFLERGELTVAAVRTTPCCGVATERTYPYHIVRTKRFDGDVNLVITEVVSPTPSRAP